jgi:hypothetical protein
MNLVPLVQVSIDYVRCDKTRAAGHNNLHGC